MNNETCPWCQTDIIWDEEIGREEACPHCYNELKDYRSLKIGSEVEEEKEAENDIKGDEEVIDHEVEELLGEIEEESENLLEFERDVEQYRQSQEDSPSCPSCQEQMIQVGMQKVDKSLFSSHLPRGVVKPLLTVPFTVDVYLCPDCFEFKYSLSEQDRMKCLNL